MREEITLISGSHRLTKRELWLMQKAWNMASLTVKREDGFKTMDEWLSNRIGIDSVVKDGLELCAPRGDI
jgi:hypothetical protein